ncbi:hydrolase, NUDIX family [Ostertagia ostertagi]
MPHDLPSGHYVLTTDTGLVQLKMENKSFKVQQQGRFFKQELHKLYEPIDAAGGVVHDETGNVLMIYRRGKWDLPKGKLDEGEDIASCALREVTEETGLHQLKLGDKICDTWHIYSQNDKNLLKRTAWYHMEGSATEQLVPQAEENILEARWISTGEMAPVLRKTYDAIKEVLTLAGTR